VEIAMDIEQQNGEESQTNDKEVAVSFDDALASCGELSATRNVRDFRLKSKKRQEFRLFSLFSFFCRFRARKEENNGILDLRLCLQINLSISISIRSWKVSRFAVADMRTVFDGNDRRDVEYWFRDTAN
jgi:hypothetical protein